MKRIVLSLTIFAALSIPALYAKEKLKILSTIKPVHSLVAAITGDLAVSEQIIPNHASPHHYNLKPSDIRRLNNADLIFQIDPNLERFLAKSLRSIPKEKVVSLARNEKLVLLPAKESHEHDHNHDDHDEEPTELDFHLWLSPANATIMVSTICEALIKIAPGHKAAFTLNASQLIDDIRKKDKEIIEQLDKVKATPFLVMHDAWQYFTNHYQLNQLGSISAQERLRPSAKAISKARSTITASKARCLVAEPSLKQRTLKVLTEDLAVSTTEIDPLGRAIPESKTAYLDLLQYTADKLVNCLKRK